MLNIMLSFLSTVRFNREKQQPDCKDYPELAADGIGPTHTTNESGLRYVLQLLWQQGESLNYYIPLNSAKVASEMVVADVPEYACTHYAYFRRRMQVCFDAYAQGQKAEDVLKSISYNEAGSQDEEMLSVVQAVQLVKKLQAQQKDRRIRLFLDLTGGPRDANMLLLIISRLLEYDPDIKMHQVIYSALAGNKGTIQIISKAYSLLDLVAGMAEFTNFGSVKSLEAYFAGKGVANDVCLAELLKAMHNFAEKISLCRYGGLKKAIVQLQAAIEAFKAAYDKANSDSQIVVCFLPQLEQRYKPLFLALNADSVQQQDLQLIKWCNENDLLQQAMTLITERLPFYVFDDKNPLLQIKSEKNASYQKQYEKYCEEIKGTKIAYKYWQLVCCRFSIGYDAKNVKEKLYNTLINCLIEARKKDGQPEKRLRDMVNIVKTKGFYCNDIDIEEAVEHLNELHAYCISEACLANGGIYSAQNKQKIFLLEALLHELHEPQLNIKKTFAKLNSKEDFVDENGVVVFKNDVDNLLKLACVKVDCTICGNYNKIFAAVKSGELQTAYDEEQILAIVKDYFELKDERNSVNHAHDTDEGTAFDALKNRITKLVQALENLSASNFTQRTVL